MCSSIARSINLDVDADENLSDGSGTDLEGS